MATKDEEGTSVHFEDSQMAELTSRLDSIIKLLARPVRQDSTQKERIWHLRDLGIGPSQIARILGTTVATVNEDLKRRRLKTTTKRLNRSR